MTASQIGDVARWRTRIEDLATLTARAEAVRLAKRVVALNEDLAANHAQMIDLVRDSKAAELLDKTCIGPVTVADVYAAWSRAGGSVSKQHSPPSPASVRSPARSRTPPATGSSPPR
ncbi:MULTISPECIES: hypothetical protein [Mumia]|uniref:Ribosomal protein L7/L12 C-terminal domain-containing protein n=1 Tax=Mumia xiangluensis TaxID=1678900 RepID=A0ABW1QHF0_9ACTN|nr:MULTISPECIES: hypothetical protein [Mumia]